MEKEFEYNWKMALLTALVLSFGGAMIYSMNSVGSKANWDMFGLVVIPFLWLLSFAPLLVVKIINKIKKE